MAKRTILFWVLACSTLLAGAMPPDPALLERLWHEGDTAAYYRMQHHAQQQRQRQMQARARRMPQAVETTGSTPNPAPYGLVILVSFTDVAFNTPHATADSALNGRNYSRSYTFRSGGTRYSVSAQGSAWQYFHDQSMGQYSPQFDVIGPVTLAHNYSYYGANDAQGNDGRADEMIMEACQLANQQGADFTRYDTDRDGEVDFVYVIYAGYGEADCNDANRIWPHTYWIYDGYGQSLILDGKRINTYACGNEIMYASKQSFGIGTFVHEFSHVLGLPDLYSTNNATHKTMGYWDIMDQGPYNNDQNTPPAFSAYERFYMGWMQPTLINAAATLQLNDLKTANKAFIVTNNGQCNMVGYAPNPTEFYLLENRQKTGWDAYLPGEGMLLTRVRYDADAWLNNTVNNTASLQRVDLIEADGKAPSNSSGKAGDAFPAGATQYTLFSTRTITDVALTGGVISFDFMGGAAPVEEVEAEEEEQTKIMRNGQLLILREGKVYNSTGCRIE